MKAKQPTGDVKAFVEWIKSAPTIRTAVGRAGLIGTDTVVTIPLAITLHVETWLWLVRSGFHTAELTPDAVKINTLEELASCSIEHGIDAMLDQAEAKKVGAK